MRLGSHQATAAVRKQLNNSGYRISSNAQNNINNPVLLDNATSSATAGNKPRVNHSVDYRSNGV